MIEQRLTEAEWRRRETLRACAERGHDWNIVETWSDGPMRVSCGTCGWSGSVTMEQRKVEP